MNRRLLLIIFAAPVLLLSGVIIYKHQHPPPQASHYDSEIVRNWAKLSFQDIKSTSDLERLVRNVPVTSKCEITEDQRNNLLSSTYNALIAMNDGSYEAYRKFRTPTPAKLNPAFFNEANREKLLSGAKNLMRPGEQVPNDFEEYVRIMTLRMNEGRGLTNYWVGVCLTNMAVRVEESTNLPPDLLTIAAHDENVGIFRPIHFFVPDHGEKEVLAENGKITSAMVSAVVSHSPPDPPYRVLIRFFWDGKYGCWVPSEYVASLSAKRKWALIW